MKSSDFISMMMRFPDARRAQGDRWITVRCRYCGDSLNPNSRHMGVKVPQNNEVPFFNCFKCHTSGPVTLNTLLKWGLDDSDGLVEYGDYLSTVSKLPQNKKILNTNSYKLRNSNITKCRTSEIKLNYINSRLGLSLNYDDLMSKKIVLNLNDLLYSNNINELTRDPNIVRQLDKGFIGFISQDNAFVNMRRLVSENKVDKSISKRYINYNIFNKFDNTLRYYTIPTKIDMTIPKKVKIYIAEGPFDILSIYYNLIHDHEHSIFTSILGSSYMQVVQFFLVDIKIPYVEFHIFVDNDIPDEMIYPIAQALYYFNIELYIHRNRFQGEKDYGVPKERIIDDMYTMFNYNEE